MVDFDRMFEKNPHEMFLGVSLEEHYATVSGHVAMLALVQARYASPQRFQAFHKLRKAARHCPNAAYNLGNYFSDNVDRRHRRRMHLAMELFARAAEMGLARLRDPSEPYSKAPLREGPLRDIISRALTNIGGKVSNAGRPSDAVSYFRQSIEMYPLNSNSHVCLGNMGVIHSSETGISPITGISAWKEAGRLGDYCHESMDGCACRANVVGVSERIVSNYGKDAANEWLTNRYGKSAHRKHGSTYVDVIASAADAAKIGVSVPRDAALASKLIADSGIVERLRKEALEVRVTVMASTIGSFLNLADRRPEASIQILDRARTACKAFEPLHAILGDEDWRDVGPPDTDYLSLEVTRSRLAEMVYALLLPVAEVTSIEKGADGVIAFLSHLDDSFRGGVSHMVKYFLPRVSPGTPMYIPANVVGSPATQ